MSFSDNKSVQKVVEKYNITTGRRDFLNKIADLELNPYFVENLNEGMKLRRANSSEYFLCEFIISPLLFEILKRHHKLNLWSHDCYIDSGEPELSGIPDYIISYKGDTDDYERFRYPVLTLADAKKDDFAAGWAQTIAEMIACQKLNKTDDLPIYGIVTNGTLWEFGVFKKDVFIQNTISYSIGVSLNKIAGILDYIYSETTQNIEKYFVENNISIKSSTNILV